MAIEWHEILTIYDGIYGAMSVDDSAITYTGIGSLFTRYPGRNSHLWAIDPDTTAASIACRDESLLRGHRHRYALATWFAMGTETKPQKLVGLVCFRPISPPIVSATSSGPTDNGIAEAFLTLPPEWARERRHVPLADERYLPTLTTMPPPASMPGIVPKGQHGRPWFRTVPYSGQWSFSSGVCAQTSIYNVALILCLPHCGGMRVDGPLSISCFAQDISRDLVRPVDLDREKRLQDALQNHCGQSDRTNCEKRDRCALDGFRDQLPDQCCMIEGLTFEQIAETMRRLLGDTTPKAPLTKPKMQPTYLCAGASVETLRRTIASVISSRLPMLMFVDAELAHTGAIAAMEGPAYKEYQRCQEFLDETAKMLDEGQPLPLPPWHNGEKPSKRGALYDPQPHCITLIGAKDIWGSDARVLYHDPLYGPYREIALRDLYSAAMVPYMPNHDGVPCIQYIVPVPDDIRFDPVGLMGALEIEYLVHEELHPQDGQPQAVHHGQRRVRLLHRDKIAAAYLRGRRLHKEESRALNALLPSDRNSKHVLCLEWYASGDLIDDGFLSHVLFAYVSPDGRSFEDGYVTPATGAISVDADTDEVQFTRIDPLGEWHESLKCPGLKLRAKDITEL